MFCEEEGGEETDVALNVLVCLDNREESWSLGGRNLKLKVGGR